MRKSCMWAIAYVSLVQAAMTRAEEGPRTLTGEYEVSLGKVELEILLLPDPSPDSETMYAVVRCRAPDVTEPPVSLIAISRRVGVDLAIPAPSLCKGNHKLTFPSKEGGTEARFLARACGFRGTQDGARSGVFSNLSSRGGEEMDVVGEEFNFLESSVGTFVVYIISDGTPSAPAISRVDLGSDGNVHFEVAGARFLGKIQADQLIGRLGRRQVTIPRRRGSYWARGCPQ